MVYLFGGGSADGAAAMSELLGGKGANLAEMARLGLPVPPGLTITTEVCAAYFAAGRKLPEELHAAVEAGLTAIGRIAGATFGDPANPLLVSVRSGSRASMPGMMDTILNLGLNDETVEGLARRSGDKRFAYDSYRRFIQMYGDVVMGLDHSIFEDILDSFKNLNGFDRDTDLGPDEWTEIIADYKAMILRELDVPFPQDTKAQLWGAIAAVFDSWTNARATTYRRLHDIPDDWGTAVNVPAMVVGNMGGTSATGVAFTRNPSTGVPELYGEFLVNAQGEDVVAGIRTPQPLTEAGRRDGAGDQPSLEALMPATFAELNRIFTSLETHYRDMQDVEFTVQDGRVGLLQTRAGKRTTAAAVRIAVDLASQGIITREEALLRADPAGLGQLLHPTIDPSSRKLVVTQGLPASPGAAVGEIVLTPDEAETMRAKGRDVILVRTETSPEDIHGMHAAVGILTARGGMTSHAAVVARGMGRPCVSGAGAMKIDVKGGTVTIGREVLRRGDVITIDGSTGQVMKGRAEMRQPQLSGAFETLMEWADEVRRLGVRANADTPADVRQARVFGAEGIGLCRTERMFFEPPGILIMREMICAANEAERRAALQRILPLQRADFEELFTTMAPDQVTIRLLDPPLDTFLPHDAGEQAEVAEALNVAASALRARVREVEQTNPMLGFRGCRLAIRYPEIAEMQARAIFEAAIAAEKKTGKPVVPEIMVPLVAYRAEFDAVAGGIRRVADAVSQESGAKLEYCLGAMVELPRTALRAGEIAAGEGGAEFFSFGTDDLTQTCLGLSRDDAAPILSCYTGAGIFTSDPFNSLDLDGVGEIVRIGVERGRAARPGIKIGICGEHGGDPASIAFFHDTGFDYVSCSPYRVPIARLAAAQAAIRARTKPPGRPS